MYSISQLRRGLSNPNLLLRECNRLYHRRLYTRPYNTAGVDVFAEDWDNLIILDACRYDMFEEHVTLPGQLESRTSRGSSTVEFLEGNFKNRSLLDTVYVTANPKLFSNRDWLAVELHEVRNIWRGDGWDDQYQTVLPETTTEHAIEAANEHEDKRLVVHYIQPHYPFLTEDGGPFDNSQAFLKPDEPGSWNQVMTGELNVPKSVVWNAYVETLQRTLEPLEKLLDSLHGKTVVTADHGNMVGDRASPIPIKEWGHPTGTYTKELVRVPWLVIEGEQRRAISPDQPTKSNDQSDPEVVEERLRKLGYV